MDCASPLALSHRTPHRECTEPRCASWKSGRGLPHSKTLRDFARATSLLIVLLLSFLPARAATVVFDRIGEQATLAAGQPGAVAIHTHPAALPDDFWGPSE